MSESRIEWTESTWNPVTGCTKISAGCANCYAERMAKRLCAMGQRNYRNGFEVTCHEHALDLPLRWRKPRTIFVNSMSDLFHEDIEDEFIMSVFDVMRRASWHQFQVLTKRAQRLEQLAPEIQWPENVWMGVTVENQQCAWRIESLRATGAETKFLSMEPLLGPVSDMDLTNIDWVIVGGESGPGSRPMKEEWILSIKEQCDDSDTLFFFKQWGGVNKKKAGRLLQGQTWDEMPESARAAHV